MHFWFVRILLILSNLTVDYILLCTTILLKYSIVFFVSEKCCYSIKISVKPYDDIVMYALKNRDHPIMPA